MLIRTAASLAIFITYWTLVESQEIRIEANETIYAVEGDFLNISCHYRGHNYTKLEWFDTNGTRIPENVSRVYVLQNNWYGHREAILLFDLVLMVDSSRYKCCGLLHYNSTCEYYSDEVFLNVTENRMPPRFRLEYVSLTFTEGEDAFLICSAEGAPSPRYRWLDTHGRQMYTYDGNWNVSSDGWLKLYSVNKSQEGIYTCIASNIYGNASKMYMVNVEAGGEKPWFERRIEEVVFPVGANVSLQCRANGTPSPEYTWYDKYGDNMHFWKDNWEVSTNGLLEIYNIYENQEGNYTCVASNILGNATKLFQIIIGANESSISAFVKEVWQTVVVFGVDSRDKMRQEGFNYFVAKYKEEEYSSYDEIQRWTVDEKDFVVTGLMPGRTYDFKLYGAETYRKEVYLKRLNVTLPPFAPLIIVNEIKGTTIKVEFPYQSMDELGSGPLAPQYFTLRHVMLKQKSGSFYEGDCPIEIQIPACYGRRYEIGGLQSGYFYRIQLWATLKQGNSDKSEVIVKIP